MVGVNTCTKQFSYCEFCMYTYTENSIFFSLQEPYLRKLSMPSVTFDKVSKHRLLNFNSNRPIHNCLCLGLDISPTLITYVTVPIRLRIAYRRSWNIWLLVNQYLHQQIFL